VGEIIRMEETHRNIKAEVTQLLGTINGCLVIKSKSKSYRMLYNVYENICDSRLMYRVAILEVTGPCSIIDEIQWTVNIISKFPSGLWTWQG
jgi:hypothetical protein